MARAAVLLAVCVVAALAVTRAVQLGVREVDMKVLVIGTVPATDATLAGIKMALDARGAPYDYMNVLTDLPLNGELPLVAATGRGKYYAIVKTSRDLAYEAAPGYWPSALSAVQWAQIALYQETYSVRCMSLHSWPFFNGATYHSSGSTAFMQFTLQHQQLDPAVKENMRVDLVGSYVTPANLDNAPEFTATGFLYADDDLSSLPNGVASAVHVVPNTNVETWHFFFIPTPYYAGQVAALQLAVNWVTKGLYLGKRRVYLGMQIDDLFLATGEWEEQFAGNDDQSIRTQVRCSADDMQLLADYSAQVTQELPEGSLIRYEFAFNGEGVVLNGGYDNDPLAEQARTNVDDFWWVTHSYSHPFLTDFTYNQCKEEIASNWEAARLIWGNPLPASVSPRDMVTPAITGLFNGDCLKALQDEGVDTVVGDNSRAELIPQNLYHGLWTSVAVNGASGTFIIPRWATNIFFDNSKPELNLAHFNHITPYTWTWEQLIGYEGKTAARNLMQYRPDPYMFHQANVASFDWPGWNTKASLMALWTQSVVDELNKYNAFPVVSVRQSKMRTELLDRMARDSCGIDAYQVVENGVPTRIHATSTGTCKLTVSGVKGSLLMDSETYGTQWGGERTVFADIAPGAEVVIDTGLNPGPTCPIVNGAVCGGNGYCDASANPAACVCAAGWSGEACTTQVFGWGDNLVTNGDFQLSVPPTTATGWGAFGIGFTVTTDASGVTPPNMYLTMTNTAGSASGAYQFVTVSQQYATSLRISGSSKATGVTGVKDGNYAIYVDVVYGDGSWQYGLKAEFETGTHDWASAEVAFTPTKPVAYLWVYCMFRNHDGTAEFDNVSVQEEVPLPATYGEPTADGRCGSNSPTNAGCPAASPCCSTHGWCGSGSGHCSFDPLAPPADTGVLAASVCESCLSGTKGECKHPDGWCTGLNSLGNCPAGTVSCVEAVAFSTNSEPYVVALVDLDGIKADAFSPSVTERFEQSLAAAIDTDAANVKVAYAEKIVTGDTKQKAELQVVVVGSGETGNDLADKVQQAVDGGALESELANNHLGVQPSMQGEARVVSTSTSAGGAGIGLALMVGAAAVAVVLGVAVGAVAMRRRMVGQQNMAVRAVDGDWDTSDRVLVRVRSGSSSEASSVSDARQFMNVSKPRADRARASGRNMSTGGASGAAAPTRNMSQKQLMYGHKSTSHMRPVTPTGNPATSEPEPELFGAVSSRDTALGTTVRVAGHRVADV